jgi:hypothetical protein
VKPWLTVRLLCENDYQQKYHEVLEQEDGLALRLPETDIDCLMKAIEITKHVQSQHRRGKLRSAVDEAVSQRSMSIAHNQEPIIAGFQYSSDARPRR